MPSNPNPSPINPDPTDPDPRPKPEPQVPCALPTTLKAAHAEIIDLRSRLAGEIERRNNAESNAVKQEALKVGVGTYTANLLPQREGFINFARTVALERVT